MTSADRNCTHTELADTNWARLARAEARDIDALANEIHQTAVDHGFWPDEGRNLGEMLMLATSELAEALEEDRSNNPTVWFRHARICPWGDDYKHVEAKPEGCKCTAKPEGALVEVADAIIRLLDTGHDMSSRTRYTVFDVIRMKMDYNHTRAHKHGKGY